jgi:hypothetical protein
LELDDVGRSVLCCDGSFHEHGGRGVAAAIGGTGGSNVDNIVTAKLTGSTKSSR